METKKKKKCMDVYGGGMLEIHMYVCRCVCVYVCVSYEYHMHLFVIHA